MTTSRWLRRIGLVVAGAMALAVLALFGAWLVGRLCSDRYAWSQWLLWIPTPIVAAVLLVAGAAAWRVRAARWTFGALGLLLVAHVGLLEHRLLRRAPEGAGFRIVHWNLTEPLVADPEPFVDAILALDATSDLMVLTNASNARRHPRVKEAYGPDHQPLVVHPFTVLTRHRVVQLRRLLDTAEDVKVTLLEIEAFPGAADPSLVVYLVDLPSDPRGGRFELATGARAMLDTVVAPAPDVVVGDLNMTRGGAALAALWPSLRHAYDDAGHGYGATFPRDVPAYHIDHVMLADDVACTRYDIVDPGVARHRAQVAWITTIRASTSTAARAPR